jgi:hypothetical protein
MIDGVIERMVKYQGDLSPINCRIHEHYSNRLDQLFQNVVIALSRDIYPDRGVFQQNRSVQSITVTQAGMRYIWKGPFLVYAGTNQSPGPPPKICKDFEMVDFRSFADCFLYNVRNPPICQSNIQ